MFTQTWEGRETKSEAQHENELSFGLVHRETA